jgi:hypothetical protein
MKNIAFLSILLCLIMACVKEGPPGPKGPDGPPYTWPPGNITGYVELRDQFGALMERRDSILLQTYNADSIFRAYTDTNGYFNLKAIPPGNYDISLSKPGFDSIHTFVQHAGGILDKFIGNVPMRQHVTTRLISLKATAYKEANVIRIPLELEFNWPAPPRKIVSDFMISVDTSAVRRDFLGFQGISTITDIDGVRGKMSQISSLSDIYAPSGTTIYISVRVRPAEPNIMWYDYATGSQVFYPYLGDSIRTQITYTE